MKDITLYQAGISKGAARQIKEKIAEVIDEGNKVILSHFDGDKTIDNVVTTTPAGLSIRIDCKFLSVYLPNNRCNFPEDVAMLIAQRVGEIEEIKENYLGIRFRYFWPDDAESGADFEEREGVMGFWFVDSENEELDVSFSGNSITESRKPANRLDFEYWDASDALTERKLYCYDSSSTNEDNWDGLIIYNKLNDRSSKVGCLILTPTSYYLAGPDEDTCFEGNSYEEFIRDLDEMMKDIKPAEITEDAGDEDLIAIENDLNETFGSLGIFVEDMGVYRDERGIIHLSLTIDGDWRHDHSAAKFQLSNSGWDLVESNVLEDRGRDDYCATYDFINVASAQEEIGKRSSPGFITEGKNKVREMARTIKDYNEFKGFTPAQKNNAFHKFVDFLDSIHAPWESNKDKQVSGKYWGIEFTLNYAGMGGHAYTIDAMNVVSGTIQDQWVGDSYPDFLEDLSELKNEYGALHSGHYPEDPENLEESRKLKESYSWEKKFKQEIRVRVVGIFRDWVDEDNAQGMVDDFDIDPDNAVEDLINNILENEADEIHEGRYADLLDNDEDEEDQQDALEEIGEAYLDELEDLDIEEKRRIFGKSHCNKLEKQMQSVSAFGDDEDEE